MTNHQFNYIMTALVAILILLCILLMMAARAMDLWRQERQRRRARDLVD
jgi:hypothetical protein